MTNALDLVWCRTFQAVLKIGNYFMGYRMPHYLEGPGKIAELVGYNDRNYFASVFAKKNGMTPMQYRASKCP